jgi:hypothetical protein
MNSGVVVVAPNGGDDYSDYFAGDDVYDDELSIDKSFKVPPRRRAASPRRESSPKRRPSSLGTSSTRSSSGGTGSFPPLRQPLPRLYLTPSSSLTLTNISEPSRRSVTFAPPNNNARPSREDKRLDLAKQLQEYDAHSRTKFQQKLLSYRLAVESYQSMYGTAVKEDARVIRLVQALSMFCDKLQGTTSRQPEIEDFRDDFDFDDYRHLSPPEVTTADENWSSEVSTSATADETDLSLQEEEQSNGDPASPRTPARGFETKHLLQHSGKVGNAPNESPRSVESPRLLPSWPIDSTPDAADNDDALQSLFKLSQITVEIHHCFEIKAPKILAALAQHEPSVRAAWGTYCTDYLILVTGTLTRCDFVI